MSIPEHVPKVSWEEQNEIVKRIENLNLNETTLDEVEHLISEFTDGIDFDTLPFPYGMSLYRGIIYSEKPVTWEAIIYPPVSKAIMSRANLEGEPMFYCSTSKKTPFYELNVQPGQKMVISNWKNLNSLLLSNIDYSYEELENLAINYNANYIYKGKKEDFETEIYIKSHEYLKNKFSRKIENPGDFKITNAISNILFKKPFVDLDRELEFDGLIYHTIRLDNSSDNMALKPFVINNGRLEFLQIEFIQIIEVNDGKYYYELLDYANVIENGMIQWKNTTKKWILNDETDEYFGVGEGEKFEIFTREGEPYPSTEDTIP